jgi:hypothetical protein
MTLPPNSSCASCATTTLEALPTALKFVALVPAWVAIELLRDARARVGAFMLFMRVIALGGRS